jgi:hypothetical protein
MKITAKNLKENWAEIKKSLMPELIEIGETSYLPFIDDVDDFDEEMMSDLELFLSKLNEALAKAEPQGGKKYKVNGRKTVKKTYDVVRTGKGKVKRVKKAKPKKEEKPKPQKEKKEKKEKQEKAPKQPKPKKDKVGESPAWLSCLQSFVKSFAGKTKDTWRVRKFVQDIQAKFSAKLGNKTPNVELLREIQDKLLTYANSDKKKVDIPAYADLVAKCKKAIKEKGFTVNNKVKKNDLKNESLSGFSFGMSNSKFSNR